MDPREDADSPETRWWLALPLAALVFTLACHVERLDEPFDSSLGQQIAGGYFAYTLAAWETHGAAALHFQEVIFVHPETLDGAIPYLNHPPGLLFPGWLGWQFWGKRELSLKLPLLPFVALAVWFLYLLARRHGASRRIASASAALLALCPGVLYHGTVASPCGIMTVAIALGCMLLHERWLRRGSGYLPYFLLALIASLCDWELYFLVPAFWVALGLERPGWREARRRGFLVGFPFGCGLILWFLGAWWTCGSLDATLVYIQAMRGTGGAYPGSFALWIWQFGNLFWREGLGAPHSILFILGIGLLFRRRHDRIDRLGLILFLWACGGIFPFWARSTSHGFWVSCTLPAAALLGVRALDAVTRRLPKPGPAFAACIFILLVAGAWRGLERHRWFQSNRSVELARDLDAEFGTKDLLLLCDDIMSERFYMRTPAIGWVSDVSAVQNAYRRIILPSKGRYERVWIAHPYEGPQTIGEGLQWIRRLPITSVTPLVIPYGPDLLLAVQLSLDVTPEIVDSWGP